MALRGDLRVFCVAAAAVLVLSLWSGRLVESLARGLWERSKGRGYDRNKEIWSRTSVSFPCGPEGCGIGSP